jgi:hypothetical protein
VRTRACVACMAVVAAAFSVGAGSASAETINFYVPISGTVTNTCTGELVAINGTAHFKETNNSSLAGVKSQIEMNLTGVKGITPTGARYVMNQQTSGMQHAEFDPFGNAQLTMEETEILTRQGETGALLIGDDFRLHVVIHLTVSNGVVRVLKVDPPRADCR